MGPEDSINFNNHSIFSSSSLKLKCDNEIFLRFIVVCIVFNLTFKICSKSLVKCGGAVAVNAKIVANLK